MNAWSAIGSMMAGGGDAASKYFDNESRAKAEAQKRSALERLRRETNSLNNQDRQNRERQNIDYQNSLKTAGVDPETGLPRSNKWIAEHPDANVIGVKKFEIDNRVKTDKRSAEERIIEKYYNNDASAFYADKNKGKNSGTMAVKDKIKAIDAYANSPEYLEYTAEVENKNNSDSNWILPGGKPDEQIVAMSPKEFMYQNNPERYMMIFGGAGSDTQAYTPLPQNVDNYQSDLKKAVAEIKSGIMTPDVLASQVGKDSKFYKEVTAQLGSNKPKAVIDPEKVKKEASKPGAWNSFAGAMDKAVNFKLNPAEAIGKAAGATAQSAARNIPKLVKGLNKVAKATYYGLSESAKAIVAVNDELKKKLSSVTTEEDARKFMDEVKKVIDADPYDYGTGNVYESRPL